MEAAIRSELGANVVLLPGHNGIFEVRVGGEIALTNGSVCGGLPQAAAAVEAVRGMLPREESC